MKKAYHFLFLFTFMFFLSVPPIKHMVSGDQLKSDENRTLAQRPDWPQSWSDIKPLTIQLEEYFNDQMGYRDALIRGANKFKYRMFSELLSKQITVGKNGFLFFNSHSPNHPHSLIKDICGVKKLSPKREKQIIETLSNFNNWLKSRNVRLDVLVVPTKSAIYPEQLPDLESTWCMNKSHWIDTYQDQVKDFVYYPRSFFMEKKKLYPVYLPNQFHWSGRIAYDVAMELITKRWNTKDIVLPEMRLTEEKSDIHQYTQGVKKYIKTEDYDYSSVLEAQSISKTCVDGFEENYPEGHCFYYESKIKTKNTIVLITNSFGDEIAKHFSIGFKKVYFVNINFLDYDSASKFIEWFINKVNPNQVLVVIHDHGINGMSFKIGNGDRFK
jgi:hypothetical protein